MTLCHCVFSRQHVYASVLWRYVAVQIWRVKELFVPGIVASTIKGTRDKAKIHVNFMKPTFLCSARQNKTYDKK